MNVVPSPTTERTSIRPPTSRTIEWTVASPRPVPPVSRFVVNIGLKILSSSALGIPVPVSETRSSTSVVPSAAGTGPSSIWRHPPEGIAWRALTTRFMRTCRAAPGDRGTWTSKSAMSQSRRICLPRDARCERSSSRTMVARWTWGLGADSATCALPKS